MKSFFYLIFLLLISNLSFSQENDMVFYLDSLYKTSSEELYNIKQVIKDYNLDKENYIVLEYDRDNTLLLEGVYADKYLTKRNGTFIEYFKNGNKKYLKKYEDSKNIGIEIGWYENGNKMYEAEYTNDSIFEKQYKINKFWDVNNKQTVIDGNGYCELSNKYIHQNGELKNGLKNGVWKGHIKYSGNNFTEAYKNGLFISGEIINSDGEKNKYFELEKKPSPKKGIKDFYKFIAHKFSASDLAYKNKIKGKIILEFVVEKDGVISDITIKKGLGYGLDEEAIRVLTSYEEWTPGEQRGQKVRCHYLIPISVDYSR